MGVMESELLGNPTVYSIIVQANSKETPKPRLSGPVYVLGLTYIPIYVTCAPQWLGWMQVINECCWNYMTRTNWRGPNLSIRKLYHDGSRNLNWDGTDDDNPSAYIVSSMAADSQGISSYGIDYVSWNTSVWGVKAHNPNLILSLS